MQSRPRMALRRVRCRWCCEHLFASEGRTTVPLMSSAPLRIERADEPVAAAHTPTQLRLLSSPERRRRPSARAVRIYALGALVGFLLAALLSAPGGTEIVTIQLVGAALAGTAAALARSAELRAPRSRLAFVTDPPRRTF